MSQIDAQAFREVLGRFPTGVTVVTAPGEGAAGPGGVAIGSFFSVSLQPPLVGFCVGSSSSSWAAIRPRGVFCVNVLADDQVELCGQMAGREDKYAGVKWSPAGSGAPILAGAVAWIDCSLDAVHPAGDHDIVVGRVMDLRVQRGDADPLIHCRKGYGSFRPLG